MQFVYQENLSNQLTLKNEDYKYLIKVRRHKVGDLINISNFNNLYEYKILSITKKEVYLEFIKEKNIEKNIKKFHLGWCIIDPKNIEKSLHSLNEIGVSKISFIYCDRSQKNFKLKLDRIKKILINSSQQCGRLDLMEIEILNNLDEFIEKYKDFYALDFGGELIQNQNIERVLIGCEGGFSDNEREKFRNIIKFNTDLILKSESAAIAIASKVLL